MKFLRLALRHAGLGNTPVGLWKRRNETFLATSRLRLRQSRLHSRLVITTMIACALDLCALDVVAS